MQFQTESVWWATLNTTERQLLSESLQPELDLRPDLLIIGGGIVGLATAYFAAEKGWKVHVISRESRLGQDAEGSLGDIFPNAVRWRLSPLVQQLAQASRDWWAKLAVRPDFQVDWRVSGALLVDERYLDSNPRAKMMELLDDGYSVRDVDAEQVAILESQLRPLPVGGLQFPSEAVLHPLKAVVGMVRGLQRFKGRIRTNCAVQAIERQGGQIVAVQTAAGRIEPHRVIIDQADELSCVPQMGDVSEIDQTSVSERRTFLATAPTDPLLNRPVLAHEWLVQLKSGEIVVEAMTANNPTLDGGNSELTEIVNSVIELIPALKSVPFVRTWTSNFSKTADHVPCIEQFGKLANAWSYHDLSGCQVMLAPMIGKLLIQWMDSNQRPEELSPFSK